MSSTARPVLSSFAPGVALTALLAVGCLGGLPPASAQEMPAAFTIDTAGWEGGAVGEPTTGQFSHCGISRDYDNGISLVFSMGLGYDTSMLLIQPDWQLEEGQEQEVRLRIDTVVDGTGPAIAVASNVLLIPLGTEAELLEVLKRGSTMTLTVSEGEFRFPLTGTMASLTAMRDCVDAARELIAEAQAQAGGPMAMAPQPAPATLGMTLGGLRGLLDAAGLDAGDSVRFLWRVGPVVGGLHQQPRMSEEVEIDTFADSYIQLLRVRCPGDLTVEPQPAEIFFEIYALKTATARCEAGAEPQVLSLLFTLDDTMYSVFFHQADAGDAARAAEATDSIYRVIRQLVAVEPVNGLEFDADALIDRDPLAVDEAEDEEAAPAQ